MNLVALSGRLARDPELIRTEKGVAIAFFTLAVDRDGEKADFISCKLVGERAEKFAEFNKKGRAIELRGQLETWLEGEGDSRRDRYVVRVDWFRAGSKPKASAETADAEEPAEPADAAPPAETEKPAKPAKAKNKK